MKLKALALAAAIAGLGALTGCETMSAEQCAVADWRGLGYADAAESGSSRLPARTRSCAERGIAADPAAYSAGFDAGMYQFCRPANGFAVARRGGSFSGVCPAELDRDFGLAFSDGQRVYSAEQLLSSANSEVSRLRGERDRIDRDIGHQEDTLRVATTEDARRAARDAIARLQRERRNVNDDLSVAQAQVPRAQRGVDALRYELGNRWGSW